MINQTKPHSAKSNNEFKIFDLLNQSVPVLLGVFIFFNPFPHTTAIKEISFYLSVVIVVVLVLFKRTEFSLKTPLLVPFGLFVFWSFLSIFWALNVENSIHDFYSHLIRYIILYFIIISFFNSKKRLVCLSWVIIISSTAFSVGGLIYYYLILNNSLSAKFASSFTHIPTNFVGFVTLFAIILTLYNFFTDNHLYRRAFLIICLFSLSAATLLTQTRSSFVALFIAGGIMLIKNKKSIFIFTLIFLIIFVATPLRKRFSLENILHNERIPNYYIMFEVIKNYPIIGIGFGNETYGTDIDLKDYQKKIPPNIKSIPHPLLTDPHNMLFSIVVRLGLVGFVLFSYILFVFGKMCVKSIKEGKDYFIKSWGRCIGSAFVGFFIIGIFEPSFSHLQETVFFTLFSMITIVWRMNEELIG
jgi:O-antigen ligase